MLGGVSSGTSPASCTAPLPPLLLALAAACTAASATAAAAAPAGPSRADTCLLASNLPFGAAGCLSRHLVTVWYVPGLLQVNIHIAYVVHRIQSMHQLPAVSIACCLHSRCGGKQHYTSITLALPGMLSFIKMASTPAQPCAWLCYFCCC